MQHEDVGGLEVAVHHAVRVQVGHLLRVRGRGRGRGSARLIRSEDVVVAWGGGEVVQHRRGAPGEVQGRYKGDTREI